MFVFVCVKCRDSEVQVGLACSRMSKGLVAEADRVHEEKGSKFLKAGSQRESHVACCWVWAYCTVTIMDGSDGICHLQPDHLGASQTVPPLPPHPLPHSSGAEGRGGARRDVRVVLCIQFVFNSVLGGGRGRLVGQVTVGLKGLTGAKSKSGSDHICSRPSSCACCHCCWGPNMDRGL